MDLMGISVVNTKLFITKKHGTAAVTQAVTCEPVTTPLNSHFFQYLDCIFLITFYGYFRPFCSNGLHQK